MRLTVGTVGGGWASACRVLGHTPVELPRAPHNADPQTRCELGRKARSRIAAPPVDFLIDDGARGLLFVPDPDDPGARRMLHETVGRVLVSHFVDPLVTLTHALGVPHVWRCLLSPTWVKAFWDRAQVAELQRFGVPNVIHLPMAAPDRTYPTEPLPPVDHRVEVSFVGGRNTSLFSKDRLVPTHSTWPGVLAHAVRGEMPDVLFGDIYHELYEMGDPPSPDDTNEDRARKLFTYFGAKLYYNAALSIRQRDRFVLFCARQLGDRFLLVGRGWDTAYGLSARAPFASYDAYLQHFRRVPINLNLVNGNAETALNLRHFEITAAGGFMLCQHRPELEDCFVIGKECDTFRNEQELLEKIRYYLARPRQREEIAEAGRRKTLRDHLCSNRLEAVIAHLQRADAWPLTRTVPTTTPAPSPVGGS